MVDVVCFTSFPKDENELAAGYGSRGWCVGLFEPELKILVFYPIKSIELTFPYQ